MSLPLALGAAAALAGLAAASRRGSRAELDRDDGRTLVVFATFFGDHVPGTVGYAPATRADIEFIREMGNVPYLPLFDHPVESAPHGSCVALLCRVTKIFDASPWGPEPSREGVQFRFYSTVEEGEDDGDLEPLAWRGSARHGTPWFYAAHDEAAENASDLNNGRVVVFDTEIVNFVNLDHPAPEDIEIAARYPALVTTRHHGLGGNPRWFFGPGWHPRDQDPILERMPRRLLSTIKQSWRGR
jgi:hypothetical protein